MEKPLLDLLSDFLAVLDGWLVHRTLYETSGRHIRKLLEAAKLLDVSSKCRQTELLAQKRPCLGPN